MPSCPNVFQFDTFLSIALSESTFIFVFSPSSSPFNSFPMLQIQSAFLLCSLRSHILLPKCFVSLLSGCWYMLAHSSLLANRIFFLVLECLILSCLDIFFVFLLSAVTSDLLPPVGLFVLIIELLFHFRPNMFQRSLSVLLSCSFIFLWEK